jgi:hypothetical protein
MKPGLQPPGVSIDTKADERGRMGNLSSTAATKSPSRRSPVRERKVKVLLGEWQETLRSTVREMRACSSLNQSCLVSLRSTNLAVLIRIGGLFLLPTRFARLARWLAFASLGVLAMLGFSPCRQCIDRPVGESVPTIGGDAGRRTGSLCLVARSMVQVPAARWL